MPGHTTMQKISKTAGARRAVRSTTKAATCAPKPAPPAAPPLDAMTDQEKAAIVVSFEQRARAEKARRKSVKLKAPRPARRGRLPSRSHGRFPRKQMGASQRIGGKRI